MKKAFLFSIAFLTLSIAASAQQSADNKAAELANRFFNAPALGNAAVVLNEILAPNFKSEHFPPPSGSTKAEYIEGIKGFLNAFPDTKITVLKQFGKGNQVFSYGFIEATHKGSFMDIPATNIKVHITFMDIWTEQDGKLIYNEVVMDMAGLMQQLTTTQGAQKK